MSARPPERVAVLGAGTMGSGIALCFARAGSAVTLASRRAATLSAARERIDRSLAHLATADVLHASAAEITSRIASSRDLDAAAQGAELVIESVVEDLAVKQDVLARAERSAPSNAVIATDTSSIRIDELAAALSRPERFAGMHWFNPPELVPLVEVVSGAATELGVAERLVAWVGALGKRPVHVRRDVEGFIANRIQYAVFREAFALVEAGVCDYADVDEVIKAGLGARWAAVGPFESLDLAGLDVYQAVASRLYPVLATDSEPARSATALVAAGNLGCKTGRGLYGAYDPDTVSALVARRTGVLLALERLAGEPERAPAAPSGA
jgi:3-hydroxybutyryl-CoA dehydrogenase